jgi:hypothetical protein
MSTPAPNATPANSNSVAATAAATNSIVTPATAQQEILPNLTTLQHAARLAIQHDRPILLDYYVDTAVKKAFLGEDVETKEKVLVKSKDEFTSSIQRSFKVGDDFIIMTENSLYIVSNKIEKKRISMASLVGDL